MSQSKRIILALAAAFAVLLFFAFVGWAGGFDFDHRNETVGGNVAMAGLLSIVTAIAVYGLIEQGPKP